MRDAQMDDLIRKMLSAHPRESSSTPCPDEDMMAAYLESALSPREAAEFESHLQDCSHCRQVLAISMKMQPQEQSVSPVPAGLSKRTLFRFVIPVPVVGALILTAVLVPVIYKAAKKPTLPEARVAEVRMPAVRKAESPSLPSASQNFSMQKASDAGERMNAEKRITPRRTPREKTEIAAAADAGLQSHGAVPLVTDETAANAAAQVRDPVLYMRAEQDTIQPRVPDENKQVAAAASPATPSSASRAISSLNPGELRNLRESLALNSVPPKEVLLGSDSDKSKRKDAESRQIGDKVFYRNAGMWIDRQCAEHREKPVIEMLPAAPEHKSILTKYPELRSIFPVVIYWNDTNYLLR